MRGTILAAGLLLVAGCADQREIDRAARRDPRAEAICKNQGRMTAASQQIAPWWARAAGNIEAYRACIDLYHETGILPGFPDGLPLILPEWMDGTPLPDSAFYRPPAPVAAPEAPATKPNR